MPCLVGKATSLLLMVFPSAPGARPVSFLRVRFHCSLFEGFWMHIPSFLFLPARRPFLSETPPSRSRRLDRFLFSCSRPLLGFRDFARSFSVLQRRIPPTSPPLYWYSRGITRLNRSLPFFNLFLLRSSKQRHASTFFQNVRPAFPLSTGYL